MKNTTFMVSVDEPFYKNEVSATKTATACCCGDPHSVRDDNP